MYQNPARKDNLAETRQFSCFVVNVMFISVKCKKKHQVDEKILTKFILLLIISTVTSNYNLRRKLTKWTTESSNSVSKYPKISLIIGQSKK